MFGINVDRPEECMEPETDFDKKELLYYVWYSVSGTATEGTKVSLSENIDVEILPAKDCEFACNTNRDDNYFLISVKLFLPWVLDYDINQLKETAKTPLAQRISAIFKRKR